MPTTTAALTTSDATAAIAEATDRLAARMTSEYTPIWDVSDFLLDAAAALAADPLAVAEVHELLRELAPSSQRTVVPTSEASRLVESVHRIAGVQAAAPAEAG